MTWNTWFIDNPGNPSQSCRSIKLALYFSPTDEILAIKNVTWYVNESYSICLIFLQIFFLLSFVPPSFFFFFIYKQIWIYLSFEGSGITSLMNIFLLCVCHHQTCINPHEAPKTTFLASLLFGLLTLILSFNDYFDWNTYIIPKMDLDLILFISIF